MSLLLEALKKAEKAKEEAQSRAKGESAAPQTTSAEAAPSAESKPVLTRAELPDIRQPLEILSEEIAPRAAETLASAEAMSAPPAASAASQAESRAAARKVFEAKFKFQEPNPRLPFYFALGLLGVLGVGTVGYFWHQLRPAPALVNANPPRPAEALAVAPAPPTAASAPITLAPAPTPSETLPPAPAVAPKPPPRPARAAPPKPAPRYALPEPVAPRAIGTPLAQHRSAPQVHPKVESGYAAYLAGDLVTARADYQVALRDEPANRDALLGLAAIDVRSGKYEAAEATYLRLLQSDPNDSYAQAGLIALRVSRLDPLATESRVKSLLAADPGANVLHFTLGNQLALQARWAEAQTEYFKAYAAEPDNADFAFNLAVSLDHLRHSKLALEYYRRAITLAEKRGASFNLAAARSRSAQLGN